jgi:hypothetical protein
MLDPLYQYMRPFELARTVNIRSSFKDSTTAHYIDLPYAASLWVLGRNIASPAEPCSIVWVVVQARYGKRDRWIHMFSCFY